MEKSEKTYYNDNNKAAMEFTDIMKENGNIIIVIITEVNLRIVHCLKASIVKSQ